MVSIYQQALDHYGDEPQARQLQEECAELIVAINHLIRGRASMEDVAGEMADVFIMLEQMRLIVGEERFSAALGEKLGALAFRLHKGASNA